MDKLSFKRMLILALITVCIALSIPAPGIRASAQDDPIAKQTKALEVESLIVTIRNESLLKSDPEQVYKAIERLGALHSVEAIEPLSHLLMVKKPEVEDVTQGTMHVRLSQSDYPALMALLEIGPQCGKGMIDTIKSEPKESISRKNAIFVLYQVFRYWPEDGIKLITKAISEETDSEVADDLSGVVKNLKLHIPKNGK